MDKQLIVWDLGGTKCSAALMKYNSEQGLFGCERETRLSLREYKNFEGLVAALQKTLYQDFSTVDAVCVGAAGMFDGDQLHLTNGYPYEMPIGKYFQEIKLKRFAVIHDYSTVLCGTFLANINNQDEIKIIRSAAMNLYGRRVVLGVGTGLGLKDGMMMANGDFWLGANEMGHLGLVQPIVADSFYLNRHQELLAFLKNLQGDASKAPLSFEDILSGKGLLRLHQFLFPLSNVKTSEEFVALNNQKQLDEVLSVFAWYLGLYVAVVELSFMPEAGIWFSGGIINHYPKILELPAFSQAIQTLPAYLEQRSQIPLFRICDQQHVFFGAAYYAVKRMISPMANHANSKFLV